MSRVKIEVKDFKMSTSYAFAIWDIEDRIKFLVDKAFKEANVERYLWISRVIYDRHNNIHIDFEYTEVENSEELELELKDLILRLVIKTYEIFLLKEKYRDKLITKYKREGKIIYLEEN